MRSVDWQGGSVRFLDQTALPGREVYVQTTDPAVIAEAIRALRIRGAPAIGVAAAFGVALAAGGAEGAGSGTLGSETPGSATVAAAARDASAMLRTTRPTAVNLFAALDRMDAVIAGHHLSPSASSASSLAGRLRDEARKIQEEDIASCDRLAAHGSPMIPPGSTILTHCNTGALATAGEGTALNIVIHAWRQGRVKHVFVDETRPLLQGARLTMWELQRAGVPATLITDNTAAFVMQQRKVQAVFVGADRIAANGDVANKIGTYGVAVLARAHGIPMYVAAPFSTVDLATRDGAAIHIEERDPAEVTGCGGVRVAPEGARVYAPAFDVTPGSLIDAIITDRGVVRAPYAASLSSLQKAEPDSPGARA
jgi:methylthioribose-1-phosphate isomerase